MTKAEQAYWEELNKMYGLNLECPKEINFNAEGAAIDMILGSSFDSAVQNNLEVK